MSSKYFDYYRQDESSSNRVAKVWGPLAFALTFFILSQIIIILENSRKPQPIADYFREDWGVDLMTLFVVSCVAYFLFQYALRRRIARIGGRVTLRVTSTIIYAAMYSICSSSETMWYSLFSSPPTARFFQPLISIMVLLSPF